MPFVCPRCLRVSSSRNDDEAGAHDEERHNDEKEHHVKETQDVETLACQAFPPSIDEAP